MIRLAAALLAGLLCQQNVDDKEADQLVLQFGKAWKNASNQPSKQEGALTILRQKQHPKLLKELVKISSMRVDETVKAACASGLGEYRKSEDAADALLSLLDKGAKKEYMVVNQRVFESLGSLDPQIGRKERFVKELNKWYSFQEASVAKAAVMAAGVIRHKDFVEPLLAEMLHVQQEMRRFFIDSHVDGCDGG